MKIKKTDKWQITSQFFFEAAVATAKSSVFILTAEDEAQRGEFLPAAISTYYSLFHLSLGMMWMFADQLPRNILDKLTEVRKKGDALPSSAISHKMVERFLCEDQLKLSNAKSLGALFRRAQELRNFANYGPRVTFTGKQPFIGPCDLSTEDVQKLVNQIKLEFTNTLRLACPETALDGTLGRSVIDQAIDLLNRSEFPFMNWSSKTVHEQALRLLSDLRDELKKKKT